MSAARPLPFASVLLALVLAVALAPARAADATLLLTTARPRSPMARITLLLREIGRQALSHRRRATGCGFRRATRRWATQCTEAAVQRPALVGPRPHTCCACRARGADVWERRAPRAAARHRRRHQPIVEKFEALSRGEIVDA